MNNRQEDIETWQDLLFTANNDFTSVLILGYTGIMPVSTHGWMFPHTLEKYLKSYLLKNNIMTNKQLRKSGHSLKFLWKKYTDNTNVSTTKPLLNKGFNELIEELDEIKTNSRYKLPSTVMTDRKIYFYIVLCSFFRYLIIGKIKYRASLYGLENHPFFPMSYMPTNYGYGELIVRKMLHFTLEHAITFTVMGSLNSMPFDDYSISNTSIFERLDDCPICNGDGSSVAHLDMVKYYRKLF